MLNVVEPTIFGMPAMGLPPPNAAVSRDLLRAYP